MRDRRGVVGGPGFSLAISFFQQIETRWLGQTMATSFDWRLPRRPDSQCKSWRNPVIPGTQRIHTHTHTHTKIFPIASRIDKREHTHTKLHPPKCSSSSSSQVPVGPGSTKTNQTSQTPSDVDSENYLPSSGPMNYNKNDNDVPRYYYARLGGLGPKTCVNFVTLLVWKDEEDLRMNGNNFLFGETTTQFN